MDAPLTVLVADDNRDVADTLAQLLELHGYRVQVAYDGAAAVRLAAAQTPDCIVLDLAMPGLNGYDAARRLRADPVTRRATLVAHTGYGDAASATAVRAAGFDYHFVKGTDAPSEIRAVLARMSQASDSAGA